MGRFALGSGDGGGGGRFGSACPKVQPRVPHAPARRAGVSRVPGPRAKPTPPQTPSSSRFAQPTPPPTPSSARFAKQSPRPNPSSSRRFAKPTPPPTPSSSRFAKPASSVRGTKRKVIDASWDVGALTESAKACKLSDGRSRGTKRKFIDASRDVGALAKSDKSAKVCKFIDESWAKSDKSAKGCKLSDGSRGKQTTSADERERLCAVVGAVEESDCAHRRRHPTRVKDCARCAYLEVGPQLRQMHGSYKHEVNGRRARTIWLASRSQRLGGAWALGCIFCAFAAQRRADISRRREEDDGTLGSTGLPRRKCRGRRGPLANTKWARFEIRALSQMAFRGVRQHAETLQHRRAARAYFMPDRAETVLLPGQDSAADEDLFHRGVPQVADWLRCWRACQTPASFRAAEQNGITENFIQSSRQKKGASRKAFAAMVRVMGLVMRARKLHLLRNAASIALGLDDRGAYRLIMFRCSTERGLDAGLFPAKSWDGWASGCLGVLRRGGAPSSKNLADLDDDYSKAMADSVVLAVQRLTLDPETGLHDQELTDSICRKVRAGVADGAACAQKALKFLATGPMPNMLCLGRDWAHAISIATKGALQAEDDFREWWDDVFNARHALVPDIKNSEEWSEMLLLCQRRVLGSVGVQGGDVGKVIRVMSFAKQRFDSCGTPQRQFCCMLVAIAMLLAYVASDSRKKPEVRARARKRLLQMPRQIFTAGLSASYSDEMIRFIRLFDVGDHDPAVTWRQWRAFEARCRALFLEGHVFCEPEDGRTCLQIAIEQARTAEPIYYEDGKVLKLYVKPSAEHAQATADSIHCVTEAMLGRLEVEFSDDKVSMLFSPFDLTRWHTALLAGENELPMQNLRRHIAKMFFAWRLDDKGAEELESAAKKLRRQEIEFLRTTPRDNRTVWLKTLEEGFADDLFSVGFQVLPTMVKIYFSVLDGTCGIERFLGALKHILDAHIGPLDEDGHTLAYLMDVRLDGPCSETDLATQPAGDVGTLGCEVALEATDVTRDFARLWVKLHGRRFGLYETKQKPGPKTKRDGTLAAVGRSVATGMSSLVAQSRQKQDTSDRPTLLGMPRRFFIQRHDRTGSANPKSKSKLMTAFKKTTARKRFQNQLLKQSRAVTKHNGKNPYLVGDLNPHRALRKGTGVRFGLSEVPRVVASSATGRIKVTDVCTTPLPKKVPVGTSGGVGALQQDPYGGYVILRPPSLSLPQRLWNAIRSCDLVVADSPWDVDIAALSESQVMIALTITATGASVLPVKAWAARDRPHESGAVVRFQAACVLQAQKLVIAPAFDARCPGLRKIFENIGKFKGSKWKFAVSDAAGSGDVHLTSLEGVRDFLRGARRVHRQHRGLNGRYIPAPAAP